MYSKKILFLVFLIFTFTLYGLEVGIESGFSTFNYAEVGPNNKDDLYTMKSGLVGLLAKQDISNFEVLLSLKAQLPYSLTFTDAFGTDSRNYLDTMFYYGLNFQTGILYPITIREFIISPGFVFNYDYFYFKDVVTTPFTEYDFSILGFGLELDIYVPLEENLNLGLKGMGLSNLLPLIENDSTFLWSYNIIFNIFLSYSF